MNRNQLVSKFYVTTKFKEQLRFIVNNSIQQSLIRANTYNHREMNENVSSYNVFTLTRINSLTGAVCELKGKNGNLSDSRKKFIEILKPDHDLDLIRVSTSVCQPMLFICLNNNRFGYTYWLHLVNNESPGVIDQILDTNRNFLNEYLESVLKDNEHLRNKFTKVRNLTNTCKGFYELNNVMDKIIKELKNNNNKKSCAA